MSLNDINKDRREYHRSVLDEESITKNPYPLLDEWLNDAKEQAAFDYNAFVLSTVNGLGAPSSRVVLLRRADDGGLMFFTNYDSEKGHNLSSNPNVCANWYWPSLERQIRIHGVAQKIPAKDSDAYFASRPRESQIGALASNQSCVVTREVLEKKVADLTEEFEGKEITRPKNWGGYVISPSYFEFWQGRAGRLHDRIAFRVDAGADWYRQRLSP